MYLYYHISFKFLFRAQGIDPPLQHIEESVPEHSGSMSVDFICQTSAGLSSNTPRKKKQKKLIKAQSQRINRLRKQLEKKRQSKEGRKERSLDEALDKLPENLVHFVRMQIKLHGKKKKRNTILASNEVNCSVIVPCQWKGLLDAIKIIHSAF